MLDNPIKILFTPKYLLIWGVSTALVMWLYMGLLTNRAMYDTVGWVFAIAFPPLVGGVIAAQWYNLTERQSCPVTAMGGGVVGSLLGIVTVACPVCPAILLGWLGLAAAIPGALLAGPWLKLPSLIFLVLALYWAVGGRRIVSG